MVIPKVPVIAMQKFDVWPQANQSAAWLEASNGLIKRPQQMLLRRQMLEEIAREDDVELFIP